MYGELARLAERAKRTTTRSSSRSRRSSRSASPTRSAARLSGGAYSVDSQEWTRFFPRSRSVDAIHERERRAQLLLEFDDAVGEAVEKLKARGLTSPYLRRSSSRASIRCASSRASRRRSTSCLPTMTKRARGINVDKIQASDVAKTGGAPEPE